MVPDKTLQYLKQRFGKYASFDAYSSVEWNGPNTVGCMFDTPIFIACREGDLKAVKTLIEMGADVNFKGDLNMTPLHDAVRGGNAAVVDALLSAGARIDAKNELALSPIDIAKRNDAQEIVDLLLEGGRRRS